MAVVCNGRDDPGEWASQGVSNPGFYEECAILLFDLAGGTGGGALYA